MKHENLIKHIIKLQNALKENQNAEKEIVTLSSEVAIYDEITKNEISSLQNELDHANIKLASASIEALKQNGFELIVNGK